MQIPPGVQDEPLYRARMKIFTEEVSLYPVSCETLAEGRSDRQWLDGVLAGGARIVQLRDKNSPDNMLLEKAHYFRDKTRQAGALFIVNDRVDIARETGADGVHVGQDDMSPTAVRERAPDLIIGLSCNTREQVKQLGQQVERRQSAVSYYNIGPLFATKTKEGLKSFLGTGAIASFSRFCPLPFTVMGGITFAHIEELCRVGARRIAVVTALTKAPDIPLTTRLWIEKITACRKGYLIENE